MMTKQHPNNTQHPNSSQTVASIVGSVIRRKEGDATLEIVARNCPEKPGTVRRINRLWPDGPFRVNWLSQEGDHAVADSAWVTVAGTDCKVMRG